MHILDKSMAKAARYTYSFQFPLLGFRDDSGLARRKFNSVLLLSNLSSAY